MWPLLTPKVEPDLKSRKGDLAWRTAGAMAATGTNMNLVFPGVSPPPPSVPTSSAWQVCGWALICFLRVLQIVLGNVIGAQDMEALRQMGVSHILNVAALKCPCFFPNAFQYKALPSMSPPPT